MKGVTVLDVDILARALARIGPNDIEMMAYSPFAWPERIEDGQIVEDERPMTSLARAILTALEDEAEA